MPQVYAPQAYINNPKLKKRYRLTLLNTSMKVIPKKNLIYMGNIGNVDEIDEKTLTPYAVGWKEFEEYIKFLSVICEREDLVGFSQHMLDVFKKN